MIYDPFALTYTSYSQGLQNKTYFEWVKRIYFILNGNSEQLGILDYFPPVFGLIKCIHHYGYRIHDRLTSGGNNNHPVLEGLVGIFLFVFTICVIVAYFGKHIICIPKNIAALCFSLIGAGIACLIDKFSDKKPPRHFITAQFLQAEAVRVDGLPNSNLAEMQSVFFENPQLSDHPAPLHQLLNNRSLADFLNNHFLNLFITGQGADTRYFITFNPTANFKGVERDQNIPSSNRFKVNFSVLHTNNTIFIEHNYKTAILINRLRSYPEIANGPTGSNNREEFLEDPKIHKHMWVKVPSRYVVGSARVTSIKRFPLCLIIPPKTSSNNYHPQCMKSLVGLDIYNKFRLSLEPDFILQILPADKKNRLSLILLEVFFNLNSETKLNKPENNKNSKNTLASDCMVNVLPKLGFFSLAQLLGPINKRHNSEIKLIMGM